MYYEFDEPVNKLAGHRILALNRGENEKILNVKVEAPEEDILRFLERKVITRDNPNTTPVLKRSLWQMLTTVSLRLRSSVRSEAVSLRWQRMVRSVCLART